MIRISKSDYINVMDRKNMPCARVNQDSALVIETWDALGGKAREYYDKKLHYTAYDHLANPATGPIYIENALPGDTLEIEIQDIKPHTEGFILRRDNLFRQTRENLVDYVSIKFEEGMLIYDGRKIPSEPMIGVIGTAPVNPVHCKVPGDHGGNLDTRLIRKGSKVYLPVFVEGALFAIGDVHAVMGDGEVCGQGVEIGADVEIHIRLIKSDTIKRPRVETEDTLAFIASADSLDEAKSLVMEDVGAFLTNVMKMSYTDAFGLAVFYGNLAISQIVNPLITIRYEISKKYLELFK